MSGMKLLCKRLFLLNDTPERLALAFALGVFLAFSPLLGLHTILAFCFSFLFGLNRVAMLVGVFVNNPWTLVPIYGAGTWLGGLFVGFPSRSSLPSFELSAIISSSFWLRLAEQWPILEPMVLGSFILSVLAAILAYMAALHMIRRLRVEHCAKSLQN